MKNLFKLTSAAAVLVAMTSCSSDILSDGVNGPDSANGKKTLIVTQEGMVNGYTTTRAVADASTKLNWERGDMIKVYDGTVYMWDGYRFDGNAFTIFTDEDLADGAAAYALYPFGSNDGVEAYPNTLVGAKPIGGVFQTDWHKGGDITAEMEIPQRLYYYEGVMNDGKTPAYWCNIPQWGTVKSTDGKLETDLKWMTAMLQVNLANVPGNAALMRITAWQEPAMIHNLKLSGNFVAVLDKENPENTQLETQDLGTLGAGFEDALEVDLTGAEKDKSVIYVPIATMRNAVIKIQYYSDLAKTNEIIDGSNAPKILKQKNYERGKYYPTKEYNLGIAGATPSAITKVLASESWQSEAEGGVATLTTTRTTEVTPSGSGDEDYIIEIPKMSGESTIVLNLEGYNGGKLLIQDVKAEDPFTGTIVLNVKDNGDQKIEINLPGAAVELKGDYDQETKVFAKSMAVAKQDVQGWTDTNLSTLEAAGTKNYVIGEGVTQGAFNGWAGLETLTVNGKVTGAIDLTALTTDVKVTIAGTKDAPAVVGGAVNTNGEVSASHATVGGMLRSGKGNATVSNTKVETSVATPLGDITFVESTAAQNLWAPKGKVTVTGISTCAAITAGTGVDITAAVKAGDATKHTKITSVITAAGDINISGTGLKATGTITATKGNVTISGENDLHEAGLITAGEKFTLTGKSKAATVVAKTAEINVDGNSDNFAAVTTSLSVKSNMTLTQGYIGKIVNAGSADITVTLGDKYNAVKETEGSHKVKFTESKWNNGIAVATKDIKNYIDKNIYTATQLAFIDKVETAPTDGFTLQNTIDLNNGEKWPMPALKCAFNGNGKTIKNLKVVSTKNDGAGLFLTAENASGVKIQKLTIEGADVQGKSGKGNVGTLVGTAKSNITVEDVIINNASVTVAGNADNVGGFIGYAKGESTFTGSGAGKLAGTFTKIQGRHNLGGLVGLAEKKFAIEKAGITIVDFDSNGAVESPNVVTDEADAKRGSVGMYVGRVEGGASTIDAALKVSQGKAVSDHRIDLGFRMNFSVNTDNKFYFYCGNGGTEVGMVTGTGATVQIGSSTSNTYSAFDAPKCVETVADIADEDKAYNKYVKAGAEDYK